MSSMGSESAFCLWCDVLFRVLRLHQFAGRPLTTRDSSRWTPVTSSTDQNASRADSTSPEGGTAQHLDRARPARIPTSER